MKWMKCTYIFIVFCTTFVNASENVTNTKFITMLDKTSIYYNYTRDYFHAVFRNIPEYELEILSISSVRAEIELEKDSSIYGDLGRVAAFKLKHPDLIQIKLPFKITILCIGRADSLIKKCDRESLAKSKIAIQKGSILIPNFLKTNRLSSMMEFGTIDQGILQIEKRRTDLMLVSGRYSQRNVGPSKDYEKYRIIDKLNAEDLYLYIKPQYHELAKKIKLQMEVINKSGEELIIYKRYFPDL